MSTNPSIENSSLKPVFVNPLDVQRANVSFNIEEMGQFFWGSEEYLKALIKFQELAAQDPILQYNPQHIDVSREELFQITMEQTRRYHELFSLFDKQYINFALSAILDNSPSGALSVKMFAPTIMHLGTDKQVEKYMPLIKSFQISGAYAQTELGHGSDVQNLETTAYYDKTTEEFIINSPTVTATKWWIGDLGIVATHVILHAILYLDKKQLGFQPFIVPVRNPETYEVLPGVTIGDIGPKMGYNAQDNGYLSLNNVRIPRENMLMRYTQVSREGVFSRRGNQKISYATMIDIRLDIIEACPLVLARALTIAVRYSLVRHQFKDSNGIERRVMDYQLQMDKLIPFLAETMAMQCGYLEAKQMYFTNLKLIEKDDFSLFKDLHPIASCLKGLYTWTMLHGIEQIRQACGGHGFSQYARFFEMLQEFGPFPTYEGENTVLLLQTARYLVQSLEKASKGSKIAPIVEYLVNLQTLLSSKCEFQNERELLYPETFRKIFRYRAGSLVARASQKLMAGIAQGMNPKEAWDVHAGIDLVESSIAHCQYYTLRTFYSYLNRVTDERVRVVLSRLCCLYGAQKIIEKPSVYFENSFMTGAQFQMIREIQQKLMVDLRPDVVGIVDSFHFHDNSLGVLGRTDGKVYQGMFEWASQRNRMNQPDIVQSLQQEYIQIRNVKEHGILLPKI